MALLYFQVPDPNKSTDGVHSTTLELRGSSVDADFSRLCRLLGLPRTRAGWPSAHAAFAALTAWQRNHGLMSDGVVGPFMWAMLERSALGARKTKPTSWLATLPPERLSAMFPSTARKNLQVYAPYVLAALDAAGYGPDQAHGHSLCQVALATVRTECEGFSPLSEAPSRANTAPGGGAFGLYEPGTPVGKKLGNRQPGDGDRFKGRGFVQLNGRAAYTRLGQSVGLALERLPFLANYPEVAAVVLVQVLHEREPRMLAALAAGDEAQARVTVNDQTHGQDRFGAALAQWRQRIAPTLEQGAGSGARRPVKLSVQQRLGADGFVLPVKRDAVDLRDLPYRPPLRSLPPVWPEDAWVKKLLPQYQKLKLVLDQGREGACTGFGLASVVNYLRFTACATDAQRQRLRSVSPRMIYELARRYDEYRGSHYQGSSCRGALKGWFKHGVCFEDDWPYGAELTPAHPDWATHALQNTLGVYYRIDTTNLVDMQAAIADVGAIYVSAHGHAGWQLSGYAPPKGARAALVGHDDLVQIPYVRGQSARLGSHAFALVGYNSLGFIVQNSWGVDWGWNGFALLRYEDWKDNGLDAWVAALGVPGVVNNTAVSGYDAAGAMPSVGRAKDAPHNGLAGLSQPPQELGARHSLVLDRGMVVRGSTRDLLQPNGLGELATEWPRQWFEQWRAQHPGEPARLVIYAHGGLNSEDEGLKRARYMAQPFLDNGCYPLFVVWKTGLMETLGAMAKATAAPDTGDRAGNFFSDHVSDPALEELLHLPGRAVWRQIKHAAEVANSPEGGLSQLANSLQTLVTLVPDLQVHLVGHSAGSILLGPLVGILQKRRIPVQSGHLYAPACTVAFANQYWLPALGPRDEQKNTFPLFVSLLSDALERQDNVALGGVLGYQKSLLYLVARSFEDVLPDPLFGMEGAWDRSQLFGEWDNSAETLQALRDFDRAVAELTTAQGLIKDPPLTDPMTATCTDANGHVVSGSSSGDGSTGEARIRTAHGSFDGDALVVLRTLQRIRQAPLLRQDIDLSQVP